MTGIWQKITDDHYVRENIGGLIQDRITGLWYWFPWDFDIPKRGPYRNLTSAKYNATQNSHKRGDVECPDVCDGEKKADGK